MVEIKVGAIAVLIREIDDLAAVLTDEKLHLRHKFSLHALVRRADEVRMTAVASDRHRVPSA